jgi:predicted TIM-barrel fold metal-dependent hydrolase
MSAAETTIATLAQIAGRGRILFGTDFPRVPPVAIDATKKNILALENDSLRSAIAHGNAVTLFPRLNTARSR